MHSPYRTLFRIFSPAQSTPSSKTRSLRHERKKEPRQRPDQPNLLEEETADGERSAADGLTQWCLYLEANHKFRPAT